MNYSLIALSGVGIGIMTLSLYLAYLYTLRTKGWKLAQTAPASPSGICHFPGGETPWCFAGPFPHKIQSRHQEVTHHPMYFLRILYLFFVLMPPFLFRTLGSSIRAGRWCYHASLSDEKIYDVFITSPLLIMANMKGSHLEITIPDMPLRTMKGLNPASLRIVFDHEKKCIEEATWQGKDILEDKEKIATLMLVSLVMWAHPQTHVAAEMSAREIARKKIEKLEPSNRFVVALHQGLLYNQYSPLATGQPLSINVDKESGVAAATQVRMPHKFHKEKHQFRYYRFLLTARKILFKHLKAHGLEVNGEFLFNNMIVHSVDHHFLYQKLSRINAWSLDGGTSVKSYWRSQVFLAVWVRHVVSPFEEEKIGKLAARKYPFYADLYRDLAEIDQELADCILASTSF